MDAHARRACSKTPHLMLFCIQLHVKRTFNTARAQPVAGHETWKASCDVTCQQASARCCDAPLQLFDGDEDGAWTPHRGSVTPLSGHSAFGSSPSRLPRAASAAATSPVILIAVGLYYIMMTERSRSRDLRLNSAVTPQ